MAKERTHDVFGRPLSEADKRFFKLRDSGYKGPIDQDGRKAKDPDGVFAALRKASRKGGK